MGHPSSETIDVVFKHNSITSLFTLYGLYRPIHRRRFRFYTSVPTRPKSHSLVLIRFTGSGDGNDDQVSFVQAMRNRYRRVAFWDDGDSGECYQSHLVPHLHVYFKKQLYKDRSLYGTRRYGGRIFTEYFHENYGVDDPEPGIGYEPIGESERHKLVVLYNLGIGSYPIDSWRPRWTRRARKLFGPPVIPFFHTPPPRRLSAPGGREPYCSGRFSPRDRVPTFAFQRQRYLDIMNGSSLFRTGPADRHTFYRELKEGAASVSPFGFGEVCFRDFEIMIHNAVLLKPDMSHLETWPDVFRYNETYVPLRWAGEDLIEKTESLLENAAEQRRIADNAWEVYSDAYRETDTRIEILLDRMLRS